MRRFFRLRQDVELAFASGERILEKAKASPLDLQDPEELWNGFTGEERGAFEPRKSSRLGPPVGPDTTARARVACLGPSGIAGRPRSRELRG
jgi:hypothetical protein